MENTLVKEKVTLKTILICIYFACLPLTVVEVVSGLSLLKVIIMMLAVVIVPQLFLGKAYLKFNSVHFFFTVYLLYCLPSQIRLNKEYTNLMIKGLREAYIAIIVISIFIYNQREKRWFENAWLAVGVICIYFGLTSTAVVEESRTTLSIMGNEEDPNQFCAYFIMPILYAVDRIAKKERFWYLYLVYAGLIMYVILTTGSRGGLLAILPAIVFYVFTVVKSNAAKIKIIAGMLAAVLLFVGIIFPMLPETTRERYSVDRVVQDKGSGRFDVWEILIDAVTSDWRAMVYGYGIGSTEDLLYYHAAAYAHNHWIQVLTDQGLIGVFLYTCWVGACFIKNWKHNRVICCGLVGIMALSMSLTFYVFKPWLNIVLAGAMNFEGELKQVDDELKIQRKLDEDLLLR